MKKYLLPVALAALSMSCALAADSHAPGAHWSYTGSEGAEHWGDMQADFATCKLGKNQSPIDIQGTVKSDKPAALGFQYTAGAAEVVNNGHTIQINLPTGGAVSLPSGTFKLVQFHFHTPSEEKVNGVAYPMVAHLVHRNDTGQLAVVAVLFKEGKANTVLERIFAAMPAKAGATAPLAGGLDPSQLLPASLGYYSFMGSLTTPPCSEEVRWQVLKQPLELSKAQIAAFQKLYPMNARPVPPLNGRTVQESL